MVREHLLRLLIAVRLVQVRKVGSTFWKGAVGAPPDFGKPPPDIVLLCQDTDRIPLNNAEEDDAFAFKAPIVEITITWNMSWSDVLDLLRYQFGRAVIFQYRDVDNPIIATRVADEREFDAFCCEAERRGLSVEVEIINATMKPSQWVWDPPLKPDNHPHTLSGLPAHMEGLGIQPSIASGAGAVATMDGSEDLENDYDEGSRGSALARAARFVRNRLTNAPRSPEQMAIFGGGGLLLSIGIVVWCYLFENVNSVAAVTLSLPCNLFAISLIISEVEEGFAPLFKLGVTFVGFWLSLAVVLPCLLIGAEYTAATAVPLWTMSCFWYTELMVRALGWPTWLTGLHNLFMWMRGGCGIPGVRKKDPKERITIIGEPPAPSALTAMQPLEQRCSHCPLCCVVASFALAFSCPCVFFRSLPSPAVCLSRCDITPHTAFMLSHDSLLIQCMRWCIERAPGLCDPGSARMPWCIEPAPGAVVGMRGWVLELGR